MTLTSNILLDKAIVQVLLPLIIFSGLMWYVRRRKNRAFYSDDAVKSGIDNVVLLFLNGLFYGILFAGLTKAAAALGGKILPQIRDGFWDGLPLALTVLLGLLLLDFINYWSHRLLHTKAFWGIHAVHHSDEHMSWTTSYRVHIFEAVIMALGFMVFGGIFNLPLEAMAAAGFLRGVHNQYVHCQLEWTHGPLRKWIVSPNNHRWHHADNPAAYNKNFGDMFVMWDRIFGTWYDPEICKEKIGLPEGPHSLPHLLAYPFVYWYRLLAPKAPASAPDTPRP